MAKGKSNGHTTPEEVGAPVTASELNSEVPETPDVEATELSLVDQFKAQAMLAESADPELDIIDTNEDLPIKEQILEHLSFQDQSLWTNISPLLKMIAVSNSVSAIQAAITELANEKKIRLYHNAHDMWGTPSGSDKEHKTTYHSIDNLNLYVKLF